MSVRSRLLRVLLWFIDSYYAVARVAWVVIFLANLFSWLKQILPSIQVLTLDESVGLFVCFIIFLVVMEV